MVPTVHALREADTPVCLHPAFSKSDRDQTPSGKEEVLSE